MLCAGCIVLQPGCVSTTIPETAIVVRQDTTRLEGWFSARGEWTLFPTPDFEKYDPFVEAEARKCASLINATGSERSEYNSLHGRRVVAVGYAIRYDTLPRGNSAADRLLSKRYFEQEVVENSCLREFVFVTKSVRRG